MVGQAAHAAGPARLPNHGRRPPHLVPVGVGYEVIMSPNGSLAAGSALCFHIGPPWPGA